MSETTGRKRPGAPKGNTNARKGKSWHDAIRKHAIQNGTLDKAAKTLCALAEQGDMAALKELGDRLDGKSVQAISNDDDGGFIIKVIKD